MLILRATGAAELDPEVLVGLLVTGLEQANLAPVLEAKWRQRGRGGAGAQGAVNGTVPTPPAAPLSLPGTGGLSGPSGGMRLAPRSLDLR
jgi:hypothetical protein